MHDAFVSHSSADKDTIVLPLVEQLKMRNISVWIDQDEILYGDNILDKVIKGTQESYAVLLILTSDFFNSFWTPVELGSSFVNTFSAQIIPVLVNVSKDDIQKKFPWILTVKYIEYNIYDIKSTASCIADTVLKLKERANRHTPELMYRDGIHRLRNLDMLTPNKISILIAEYEQISKINMNAAYLHASIIGKLIIDEIYEKHIGEKIIGDYRNKLIEISSNPTGVSQNICEHLKLFIDNNGEFLSSTFSNDTSRKKLIDMSLASIIDWYLSYLSTVVTSKENMFFIAPHGSLSKNDFNDMYEIDTLVLRDDLIASPDVTYSWYEYNVYSHIAIRNQMTKKIAGYMALFPITDDLFREILNGDFKDNDLSITNMRRYDIPDFYILYIACVAIHPNYQNTSAFSCLYRGVIQMLLDLAVEREIYVVEIITEASTLQGEKLCKIVGLKKTLETKLNTSLYQGTLLPPSLRLKSMAGNKLISFYQTKYEQFKLLF